MWLVSLALPGLVMGRTPTTVAGKGFFMLYCSMAV